MTPTYQPRLLTVCNCLVVYFDGRCSRRRACGTQSVASRATPSTRTAWCAQPPPPNCQPSTPRGAVRLTRGTWLPQIAAAQQEGKADTVVEELMKAYFCDEKFINDRQVTRCDAKIAV